MIASLRRVLVLAVLVASACYDPVHADEVAALGPEAPGVPEGPTHRPGQRCTTCHGDRGPGSPELSVAGTLFRLRGSTDPVAGGKVTVTDATGKSIDLTTNSVGNFYIEREKFDPVFPLEAYVLGDGILATMKTTIGRDAGCATCHRATGDDPQHVTGIFVQDKKP